MIAVVLILLEEESIPGVWAIPLAIIAAILGGLYFLRVGKLAEQRSKKFKNLAEQMGMEFSVEDEWDIGASLSAFDLFWEADITNVLSGDSEQLGYGEEFEVTVLECSYVVASARSHIMTIPAPNRTENSVINFWSANRWLRTHTHQLAPLKSP